MKMYDGVIKRVELLEKKSNIRYAKTNGMLYKTLKIALILSFIYGAFIKFLYFFGAILNPAGSIGVITSAICTALLVLGFVLVLCKIQEIGAVITTGAAVVLLLTFSNILKDEVGALTPKFYWAHLIPLAVLSICALWMAVIALRQKLKLRKMYVKVVENIYEKYKVNIADGADMDEAQWEEFLNNFDPENYNAQFLKN